MIGCLITQQLGNPMLIKWSSCCTECYNYYFLISEEMASLVTPLHCFKTQGIYSKADRYLIKDPDKEVVEHTTTVKCITLY